MQLFRKIFYTILLVLTPLLLFFTPILLVVFNQLTPIIFAFLPFSLIATYCLAMIVSEEYYGKKY